MKLSHLFATLGIIICTAVAWFILATTLSQRTEQSSAAMRSEVSGVWGPELCQEHPEAWFETPNAPGGKACVLPSTSKVEVNLHYDPKRRGLIWHRTYDVAFKGSYTFTNPTKIAQTLYLSFPFPESAKGLKHSEVRLGDDDEKANTLPDSRGRVIRAVLLAASSSITLNAGYETRGSDSWKYHFPDNRRIAGFDLSMKTDFTEINFPVGTGSAGPRKESADGFNLEWNYPDDLAAPSIGMDMPKRLNAGPVASRIAFFAPVSLLLFVTVGLLIAGIKRIPLHPMHVFFVAAGFFAFHLLFAYLVDLLPLVASFTVAAVSSLLLVCGYLRLVGGAPLFKISLPAQALYLILFSASFFFDGLTGITLTILSVLTLALLMALTAKLDWRAFFQKNPPPLPGA